jgi:hypothetical protein
LFWVSVGSLGWDAYQAFTGRGLAPQYVPLNPEGRAFEDHELEMRLKEQQIRDLRATLERALPQGVEIHLWPESMGRLDLETGFATVAYGLIKARESATDTSMDQRFLNARQGLLVRFVLSVENVEDVTGDSKAVWNAMKVVNLQSVSSSLDRLTISEMIRPADSSLQMKFPKIVIDPDKAGLVMGLPEAFSLTEEPSTDR